VGIVPMNNDEDNEGEEDVDVPGKASTSSGGAAGEKAIGETGNLNGHATTVLHS